MDALFLGEFVTGKFPFFAHGQSSREPEKPARLLPAGVDATRWADVDGRRCVLAHDGEWILRANRYKDGRATITVIARRDSVAEAIVNEVDAEARDPHTADDAEPVSFWHDSGRGARRTLRRLTTQCWSEIRGNYSAQVSERIRPTTEPRTRSPRRSAGVASRPARHRQNHRVPRLRTRGEIGAASSTSSIRNSCSRIRATSWRSRRVTTTGSKTTMSGARGVCWCSRTATSSFAPTRRVKRASHWHDS